MLPTLEGPYNRGVNGRPPDERRPPDEEVLLEPTDDPAIPLGDGGAPAGHLSFNAFWTSLGHPESPESDRLRELFYEWLGQNGYDVHLRDEPTILGDATGWRDAWARYLRRRKLE